MWLPSFHLYRPFSPSKSVSLLACWILSLLAFPINQIPSRIFISSFSHCDNSSKIYIESTSKLIKPYIFQKLLILIRLASHLKNATNSYVLFHCWWIRLHWNDHFEWHVQMNFAWSSEDLFQFQVRFLDFSLVYFSHNELCKIRSRRGNLLLSEI